MKINEFWYNKCYTGYLSKIVIIVHNLLTVFEQLLIIVYTILSPKIYYLRCKFMYDKYTEYKSAEY